MCIVVTSQAKLCQLVNLKTSRFIKPLITCYDPERILTLCGLYMTTTLVELSLLVYICCVEDTYILYSEKIYLWMLLW